LTLDAFVERFEPRGDADGAPPVLGHTTVTPEPVGSGPIRLSFDAIASLLQRRRGERPLLYEHEIGIALGRVLAHEIGHALLGASGYHDQTGLMRTTFECSDLVWPGRSGFRLMPQSVARLQARVAWLSGSRS